MANQSNVIQFPVRRADQTQSDNILRGAMSKTVYPIKDIQQIRALQRYLLNKATEAKTPSKAMNAYRNWFFFALGINMGFRGGDITELTWDRLVVYDAGTDSYEIRNDACYNFIHAEKTGKAHYVVINEEARKHIDFYLAAMKHFGIRPWPYTPVFPSNKKAGTSEATVAGHVDCDHMGRILREAAKAVGIKQRICTHSMRKTFGYLMYQETGDIITLQEIFGHSSPAITLRYIGITAEDIENAYSRKPDTSVNNLMDFMPTLPAVDQIAPATIPAMHIMSSPDAHPVDLNVMAN